jgi:ABC-2 type transport system ATP-binding protein
VALVVEEVTKRFANVVAVDRLSMEIPQGTMFGLLGPNGAGKTTTVRVVLGIIKADEGRVTWN